MVERVVDVGQRRDYTHLGRSDKQVTRNDSCPPKAKCGWVGQWRRLQQTGSVAGYADHTFRLKALCEIGEAAEFKLAFYGLQPELQAEVRKYLRQNRVR